MVARLKALDMLIKMAGADNRVNRLTGQHARGPHGPFKSASIGRSYVLICLFAVRTLDTKLRRSSFIGMGMKFHFIPYRPNVNADR